MPGPSPRQALSWLVEVEDHPERAHLLGDGRALVAAAVADGVVRAGDEDAFGLALLTLWERGFIRLGYPTLDVDQGPDVFRGAPAYHLQQTLGAETTPEGRGWMRGPGPSHVISIHDSTIGQLALGDINNTATLVAFVQQLELAIENADAPREAKNEARRWLERFGAATRAGGDVAKTTAVDLLARVISHALGIPPA